MTPTQPEESANNETVFYTLLRKVRPDVFVLIDLIDSNRINTFIILKIMYQLLKIATHNGHGKINIFMEDGVVTRVDGIDSTYVNEKMIVENTSP